ncbi:MAG TPA: polysaccharide pyruvyl transferase family protein [Methylomirabilota bacterium]|nr:polysaccharide pyruvyl transferase family protein [Methylomirabilota bacterium]
MKVALLGFTTVNLGDDLQGIATSLNLPHVDRIVERDRLATLSLDERHFCMMQSWFTKQRLRAPSDAIDPMFFGFCFGGETMQYGLWPRYLRAHQPIGARDTRSVELMKNRGVDTFWSGCLTLRMGSFLRPIPREERSGTFMVDVLPDTESAIPDAIKEKAVRISNAVPPMMLDDPLARMARIARMCDRLRRAELVITKRLHTALPCVGFGTPTVVFAKDRKGNRHRFSGYESFLSVTFFGEKTAPPSIDWANVGPAVIPDHLNERYAKLRVDIAAKLGAVDETRYDEMARTDTITIANPGLGHESGRIRIDLGMAKVERLPTTWTSTHITFDLESFASFERYRMPVEVQGSRSREWVAVGATDQLIAAATTGAGHAW